jgi:UDP-glucuronate 4-epimerase
MKSVNKPSLYIDNNTSSTSKILHEIQNMSRKPLFIYASSATVYGNHKQILSKETDFLESPLNAYSFSKKMGEELIKMYSKMYGIKAVILRIFNVYGPCLKKESVINNFLTNLIENKNITLNGNGASTRDYIYIDDVIDGILKTIIFHKNSSDGLYEIYNLCTSNPTKTIDLLKLCENLIDKKSNIQVHSNFQEEIVYSCGSSEKAYQNLGFKSQINLLEGLKLTLSWMMETKFKNKKSEIETEIENSEKKIDIQKKSESSFDLLSNKNSSCDSEKMLFEINL